eukprot:1664313-Ditylum_brightwellii.AAC.1
MSLEVLMEVLPKEMFDNFDAYLKLRIVPEYGTSYSYTACITSNMLTAVNNERNTYSNRPPNAWSQGPPKTTQQKNPT